MQEEARLTTLMAAGEPKNWLATAAQWKAQGGKVVGLVCSSVPEEVLTAAGILPVRLARLAHSTIRLAFAYRPVQADDYYTNVIESALAGELAVLDGVVGTNRDDDMRRLMDVLGSLKKFQLVYMMHSPFVKTERGVQRLAQEVRHLLEKLESLWGIKVSDDQLRSAAEVHNQTRRLVQALYTLRKRQQPPLSASEHLRLCLAAMTMPRAAFNKELQGLLPHIEGRQPPYKASRPRVMVSGDVLDEPTFLDLVEEAGCVVATDDLDLAFRYFAGQVDTKAPDIADAIARHYLGRPAGPRFPSWEEQVADIVARAREYQVDGIIELALRNSLPVGYRSPIVRMGMAEARIPFLALKVEYTFTNAGQLRTRLEAFQEMLRGARV